MSEHRQTYTLDANGQPLTIHQDSVTMPADHSFACVNDYVHATERHFEELQGLALGMACEIDKLRAEVERYRAAWDLWHEKTEWVQQAITEGALPARYLGMHRADIIRAEIERLRHAAARYQFLRDQQALPPDQARYAVMRWNERAAEWLHLDLKLDPEIDQAMEARRHV